MRVDFDVIRLLTMDVSKLSARLSDRPVITRPFALFEFLERTMDADEADGTIEEHRKAITRRLLVVQNMVDDQIDSLIRKHGDRPVEERLGRNRYQMIRPARLHLLDQLIEIVEAEMK